MKIIDLPSGSAPKALKFPHFPTRMQAFVWRNWSLVSLARMALVLKCSEKQVLKLGVQMGLKPDEKQCHIWNKRGYITIIRRNWHLLPYEQILELLDWSAEEMAFVLKEDDFLYLKLGAHKPQAEPVVYVKLNKQQIKATEKLRNIIQKHFDTNDDSGEFPFEFLNKYDYKNNIERNDSVFGMKMAYSYSAVYGDPLLDSNNTPYPEKLLKQYAENGINAVWLQGTLYTLVPWLGETKYSANWELRLENLRKLTACAAKYGIKVYLYMNEPRNMPTKFFEGRPKWRGAETIERGSFALCTSNSDVLTALRKGMVRLFEEVPGLGGVFTITMSENTTHCRAQINAHECPVCAKRPPAEFPAEINRAIAEGVHSVNPEADVIAWSWGWQSEWAKEVVALLPKDVKLMCVSETARPTLLMNIPGQVGDYSISKPGPGPSAKVLWKEASKHGLRTVAKVQLNNTWECSAVPYIPVPDLIEEHLENLKELEIFDLMTSWTLGGYPGGNMKLLDKSKECIANERFGVAGPKVLLAWEKFSKAFREFPLNQVAQLYLAPQNYGPMNLLFATPTGYQASMIGFPYDDLEGWCGNHYPESVLEEQFRKLSEGWQEGLEILRQVSEIIKLESRDNYDDLLNVAEAIYCHFRSSYLQICFIRRRERRDKDELFSILDEEIALAKHLAGIVMRDSRIGFEASNHYYYVPNDLKEKVINCEYLKQQFV